MVYGALLAGAGMVMGEAGNKSGAKAYRKELANDARVQAGQNRQRRDSIRELLATVNPESQLQRAGADARKTYAGQHDIVNAVRQAYGMDNPQLADELAIADGSINDASWQRAFGLVEDQDEAAYAADADRQQLIDRDAWWWQRFMPNRLQRAGDKGKELRMGGQILSAYGLGTMNQGMATKKPTGGQIGSNATNAETGRRMTSDLSSPSWLGLGGGVRPAQPTGPSVNQWLRE